MTKHTGVYHEPFFKGRFNIIYSVGVPFNSEPSARMYIVCYKVSISIECILSATETQCWIKASWLNHLTNSMDFFSKRSVHFEYIKAQYHAQHFKPLQCGGTCFLVWV